MYIKYIFVLCLTYYLRTVNSIKPIDTKQIKNLWKAINDYSLSNHNISYDDLTRVYPDENPDELEALIDDYGFKCETDNDDSNDAIDFEGFKRAAFDGNIHRWTKQAMHNEFLAIIPEKEDRKYIILNDLIEYYESRILEPELKVIIEEYGIFEDKEYHLYVNGFRKVLNIGLLPKPLCDESESLESVYTVYLKILEVNDDYKINKRILMKYYSLQIDNIFDYYGDDRWGTGSREFNFWNFRKAVTSGNLPLKMYKGNAFQEVTPMRRLRSETAAQLQIEFKNLKKKVLDQEAIIKQLQVDIKQLQIKNLKRKVLDQEAIIEQLQKRPTLDGR